MEVKIALISNGSEISVDIIENVYDEMDPCISKAVEKMARDSVLATGDTITITEID